MLWRMANSKTSEAARVWQARIEKFFASGLTAKEFIEQEGLGSQAFFDGRRSCLLGVKCATRIRIH
jgi:hypothetical protein